MKKTFLPILIIISLLLVPNILAIDIFDVSSVAIKDTITYDGVAEFRLTITNNQGKDDKFRIFNDQVEWDVHTDPRTDSSIFIRGRSSATISIEAIPMSNSIREGQYYQVPVSVKSINAGIIQTEVLPIGVRSPEEIEDFYSPRVDASLVMKREVDPREDINLDIELNNRNPKDFPELKVALTSKLVNEEKIVSLEPYEKKTVNFKIDINDLQEPIKDVLNLYVTYTNERGKILTVAKDENNRYEIIGYGAIEDSETVTKKFLKTTRNIKLSNNANDPNEMLYKTEAPLIRIFYSVNPDPQIIKEGGKTYYGFDVSLKPQEEYNITITRSYRGLFYLIILLIIIYGLYIIYRSPLVITKSTSNIVMREGGISELKIILSLKNRSYKPVEDISVTDKVPPVAEIKKEFEVGTLQPTRILKHEKKGTFVKWKLEALEPFEERILSYTIKSKLSILGEFKLPIAKSSFKYGKKRRKTTSNQSVSRC